MAFHVACPITCQRICYCELGFPARLQGEKGRRAFAEEVTRVEEFLRDPWCVRAATTGGGGGDDQGSSVQVLVPRIAPAAAAVSVVGVDDGFGVGDLEAAASVQTKRVAMQRQAAAASMAAEDYAWKLETGAVAEAPGEATEDLAREDQGSLAVKVICRICFLGENEGSDRVAKMLSCKTCNKKYHRSCLKSWAENRDLFHWSSWACPSCRICEVCRRVGDPSKFMFCKRCDAASHCYCQQPPHKNVGHGPYLCPKHTRCHSCGSSVPGGGLSTRWFLGYTCCDACGRLFVKGNYCPVCLKVYRDSESTPMVCCDVCQRWVHCLCDGISDEKYQQFQADGNLYYKCAACRGDCYQVKDIDDAVQELWRRRDKADRDLIASLRAAAGLPFKEELFSISPFSDDEESRPVLLKSNHGRSLKFSLKGITDKTTKGSKEYGKKSSKNSSPNKKYGKKKEYEVQLVGKTEEPYQNLRQNVVRSVESSFGDEMTDDTKLYKIGGQENISVPMIRSPGQGTVRSFIEQADSVKHSFTKEVPADSVDKASVETKGNKSYGFHPKEGTGKHGNKSEPVKGTKLVIHLSARNKNMTSSPRSEASSCQKEHDIPASNGSEASSQQKANDNEKYLLHTQDGFARPKDGKGAKLDPTILVKSSKYKDGEVAVMKLGKASDMHTKISRGGTSEECEPTSTGRTLVLQKRNIEGSPAVENTDEAMLEEDELMPWKTPKSIHVGPRGDSHDAAHQPYVSNNSFSKDSRPLLKVKVKNPYLEIQSSWVSSQGEEERNSVKGQRSKRKRPTLMEKVGVREDTTYAPMHPVNSIDEVMDANWILQKLGKDAIGKRVEIHQPLDNSWHKGVVSNVIEGTTSLSVRLDDGGTKTLELGKQGIRFISQKQRRTTKL